MIDLTLPEKDQVVQIFEEAHYVFERFLLNKIATRVSLNDHAVQTYYELEDGRTVVFSGSKKKSPMGESNEYTIEDLVKRPPYNIDVLEETYSLDELLYVPTYEEVRNAFYGVAPEEQESESYDPAPKPETTGRRRVEAPVEQPIEEPVSSRRRQAEPVAEQPVASRRRGTVQEVAPAEQANPTGACPFGHVFGADCEKFIKEKHCTECDTKVYEKCAELHDSIKS
mgnify:CR=1 FL=1